MGGRSSKPPAMKTLRDYLVQPPHFPDRVAGAQRGEGICSVSLGMSMTQAPRAGFSIGHNPDKRPWVSIGFIGKIRIITSLSIFQPLEKSTFVKSTKHKHLLIKLFTQVILN